MNIAADIQGPAGGVSAIVLAAFFGGLVFANPASAQENCAYPEAARDIAEFSFKKRCDWTAEPCDPSAISDVGYAAGRLVEAAIQRDNADVVECVGLVAVEIEKLVEEMLKDDSTFARETRAAFDAGLAVGLEGLPPEAALVLDDSIANQDFHASVQRFGREVMGIVGDDIWYRCRHPEWPQELGVSDILVPGSVINKLGQGPGVTCTELYDSEASSRIRACEIAAADGSVSWAIWVGGNAGIGPLACN